MPGVSSAIRPSGHRTSHRRTTWGLLLAVLAYATALRAWQLGATPLWTDEAETSINALTILQHGMPVDRYLGLPLYENTLTRPWPEHPEYEFKDSSYSSRGLAIYHGWLPLYATAASFWLFGIQPDEPPPSPAVRLGARDMHRRTAAARAPGVVFGAIFLLAMFLAARESYGGDAGWAALAAATVNTSAIALARQARYYSATLAVTALCALVGVRMIRRGRRRDFAVAGMLFALLFHTNILAFISLGATLVCSARLLLRQDRIVSKLCLLGGVLAAGVLPWAVGSGFLASAFGLPMARSLLGAAEITRYLVERLSFVLLACATLLWLFLIWLFRSRVPERVLRPFAHARPVFVVLAAWTAASFLAFNVLTPAASYFQSRLSLVLLVPALLFGATLFAAAARAITHHRAPALAAGLFVLLLQAEGKAMFWWPAFDTGQPQLFGVVERLQAIHLEAGTRLYGNTGTSLQLMFYSGLPVQNVMPVRRSFLETYDGEIVIIEGPGKALLPGPEIQQALLRQGVEIGEDEAWRVSRQLNDEATRRDLERRGVLVCVPRPSAPAWLARLAPLHEASTNRDVMRVIVEAGNPMFKGFAVEDFTALWQVFFYRFVNPEARMGANLNYARRILNAEATLLPGGWALIRSPAPPARARC